MKHSSVTQVQPSSADIYSRIGFILLAVILPMYTIFPREFAQIHIQLPFLNFPIFIGEILLFTCLLLTAGKLAHKRIVFYRYYWCIFAYLVWVLYKAIHGYLAYGPLAFRTAALFYYPLFFICGYVLYDRKLFTQKMLYLLAAFLLYLQWKVSFSAYFRPEVLVLTIIVALNIKDKKIKYSYLAVLVFLFPYPDFFSSSKSHLVGLIAAFVFLLFILTYFFMSKIKRRYRMSVFVAAFLVLLLVVYSSGRTEKIRAMFNLEGWQLAIKDFYERDKLYQEKKKIFPFQDIKPQLYSQEIITFSDRINDIKHGRVKKKDRNTEFVGLSEDSLNSGIILIKRQLREDFKSSLSALSIGEESLDGARLLKQYDGIIEGVFESAKNTVRNYLAEEKSTARRKDDFSDARFRDIQVKAQLIMEDAIKEAVNERKKLLAALTLSPVPTTSPSPVISNTEATKIDSQVPQAAVEPTDSEKVDEQRTHNLVRILNSPEMTGWVLYQTPEIDVNREYSNVFFRLSIWSDMLDDLKQPSKTWGYAWVSGVNFGMPQRSRRIEIWGVAAKEWQHDGWITPHNSYLHILYRAGILGVVFIVVLLLGTARIVKGFVERKSFIGILLCSFIIYLLTIANFLVFLEFPYNAIPLWTSFGMIVAYLHQLENKKVYEDPHHS